MAERQSPDAVVVGIVGSRLRSILNEQQAALINTAFSPVVRESFDLACAVFDSRGEMIGQSDGGTPGHINAMATGMHHIVAKYNGHRLRPGDVVITNDPWMTSGQINDITIATPVFQREQMIGWFASCCHSPDIGGRVLSAQATEVFEEGLRLPIMLLLEQGTINPVLEAIIRANVRTPDETIGDLYAQVAGNDVGARRLVELLDEFGLAGIDTVATAIIDRSEAALREAIRAVPDGVYEAESTADGYGAEPVTLRLAVTIDDDAITLDYDGSSPQSPYGINVVYNYTRAYSSFAIKAAFAPEVPHNAGSFRPVTVTAPDGCVLNCREPAPVAARHLVGHFLPSLIFAALQPAMHGKLLAYSSDGVWLTVAGGVFPKSGVPFTYTMFQAGGMGARAVKDGLSSTGFPGGLRVIPTEVTESLTPPVQRRRELATDSGGPGRWRGGLGQDSEFECQTDQPWSAVANGDRIVSPARGTAGGEPGRRGQITTDGGERLPSKQRSVLQPTDRLQFVLPGGGGYGPPHERDIDDVLDDVVNGYCSLDQARSAYGVVIEYVGDPDARVRPPSSYRIDHDATARLRQT